MVRRVELFFFLLFLLLLGVALSSESAMDREKSQDHEIKKSVQILQGDLREINASEVINEYRSLEAYLVGKVWYFRKFVLINPQIELLRSDRAKREEKRILMEGNVTLKRLDGSIFRADSVSYFDQEKLLRSEGAFYGRKGESYVRGRQLYYDLRRKITRAQQVFAHYRLGEKLQETAPSRDP